jgi:heptosyltransferase III
MKGDTLIVHQGALGDLILTLGALRRFPDGKQIDICCRARFIPLVCHLNAAEHAFNVESREFADLYTEKPDKKIGSLFSPYSRIILFSNSSALIKNIASLAECPVYAIPPRPEPETGIHVAAHLVAQLAGVLPDVQLDKVDSLQDLRSKNRFREKILIHPGSGSLRKNWALENFIGVFRKLKENGIDAHWIIGPAEKFLTEQLLCQKIQKEEIWADNGLVDFCRRLPLYTAFIGNDSGLTHLAAYLGVPVVAVFGPSDPVRWRPVGQDVTVVCPQTDCPPCFELKPANCADAACLESISVDRILAKIG